VIRISSVGKRAEGRRSHQHVDRLAVFVPTVEASRQPGARQFAEDRQAPALEAGVFALPERRRRRQHQQVGQEVAQLIHEIDALLVVLDTDMNVHSAHEEAAAEACEIMREGVIAGAVGMERLAGARERMGRGGDRREAVARGAGNDAAPEALEFRPRLIEGSAGSRADLDLRAEKLRRHLRPQDPLAVGDEARGRLRDERARRHIDEVVFLFDTDGQRGLGRRHGGLITGMSATTLFHLAPSRAMPAIRLP
jgi:hypothetical protein